MALQEAQEKHAHKKRGGNAEPEQKPAPITSPERQAEILNPDPNKLDLFGKDISLHPLPAKWSLQFAGFSARVIGASRESAGDIPAMRIGGVLAERYADDFLRYLARATSPTNVPVSEQQINLLAEEMSAKLDAMSLIPLAKVFMAMVAQNKIFDALSGGSTGAKN